MKEKEYYKEIVNLIEEKEINTKIRELKDNKETLLTYWNIGKLLVEAQGGEKRAKYGDELIKKWSNSLIDKYGTNYSKRNLNFYRQFYIIFKKVNALRSQLTWTHYKILLPIKDENKRNYYINQVILNNLSSRELIKEIKSNSYERLSFADKENIKLITDKDYFFNISETFKDQILINVPSESNKLSEKLLHKYIIEMLKNRFLELGIGFALIGHEYKLVVNGKTFKIDLLFFNIESNSYVVIEIKNREFQPKDIGQLEFYTNYIDKNIKKNYHNKTIGILIVKKKDKYVIEYISNKDLYVLTYKVKIKKNQV